VKENIENHVAINEAVVKIEAKSAGASYIKDLRELFGMNATEHLFPKQSNLKGTTEKVVKIRSCINYLYAGNVFLIEEELNNEWIDEFLREAESFPKGKNDDQLDTLAMAIMDAMYDSITDTSNDFKKYF
jgi:predicted phage terminase large subunit-like protein